MNRDRTSPFLLAQRLAPDRVPCLHLDDGLPDSLAPETEAFAKLLAGRGIAHSLVALAGDHERPCWKQAFEHTLPVLKDHLRRVEPGERGSPARRCSGRAWPSAMRRRRRTSGSTARSTRPRGTARKPLPTSR